jgi:hypothetical protein
VSKVRKQSEQITLPKYLKGLFWEFDLSQISLNRHRDFIIERVLSAGGWRALQWLRKQFTDAELRDWFLTHKGRGLSPQQLCYWELMLGLDSKQTDKWVAETESNPYFQRANRLDAR